MLAVTGCGVDKTEITPEQSRNTDLLSVAGSEIEDKGDIATLTLGADKNPSNINFTKKPSLINNPNSSVPLAVLISFHSKVKVKAKYVISDGVDKWTFSNELFNEQHNQPLVHFKAGKQHSIDMRLTAEDGSMYSEAFTFNAPSIPLGFPSVTMSKVSSETASSKKIRLLSLLSYPVALLQQSVQNSRSLLTVDAIAKDTGLLLAVNAKSEVIWYYQSSIFLESVDMVAVTNSEQLSATDLVRLMNHDGQGIEIDLLGNIKQQWTLSNVSLHPHRNRQRLLDNGVNFLIDGFQSFADKSGVYIKPEASQLWEIDDALKERSKTDKTKVLDVSALSKDNKVLWALYDAIELSALDYVEETAELFTADAEQLAPSEDFASEKQTIDDWTGTKNNFIGGWSLQLNTGNQIFNYRLLLHDDHQQDPEQVLAGTFDNNSIYARIDNGRITFKVYDRSEGIATLYNYQGNLDPSGTAINGQAVIATGPYSGSHVSWKAQKIN